MFLDAMPTSSSASVVVMLALGSGMANAPFLASLRGRFARVLRPVSWLMGFVVWQIVALALEQHATSGLVPQAWGETLSVSFLLYAVLAFPAMVWRFLR